MCCVKVRIKPKHCSRAVRDVWKEGKSKKYTVKTKRPLPRIFVCEYTFIFKLRKLRDVAGRVKRN